MSKLQTPTNETVARMAAIIVSKEVTRILGPKGAMELMKIAALNQLIHPRYRAYYDAVDKGEIHLESVKHYFSPDAWAMLSNPKRRTLEAAIRKEVEKVKKNIHTHMLYLHQNDVELATLSAEGQAMLQQALLELTGEGAGEPGFVPEWELEVRAQVAQHRHDFTDVAEIAGAVPKLLETIDRLRGYSAPALQLEKEGGQQRG